MNLATVIFVFLALINTTRGGYGNGNETLKWGDPTTGVNDISGLLMESGMLTRLPPDVREGTIKPIREAVLANGDQGPTTWIVLELELKDGSWCLFYVLFIFNKIVLHGEINTRFPWKPEDEITEIEQEAGKSSNLKSFVIAIKWERKHNYPLPKTFLGKTFQFATELYFTGSNENVFGIYRVQMEMETSFCFAVLKVGEGDPVFTYMGAHHRCRVEAFRDAELYANNRRELIIDLWDNSLNSLFYQTAVGFKPQASADLGWPISDFEVECVKNVSNKPRPGLIIIFRFKKLMLADVYVAVAAVRKDAATMQIRFVEKETKNLKAAKSEIEDYFLLAVSDKVEHYKEEWIWAWKIYNCTSSAQENIDPPSMKDLENIKKQILKNTSFPIPDGGLIYLQKLRKLEFKPNGFYWVAVYGYMEKLFLGADPNLPNTICTDLNTIFESVKTHLPRNYGDISALEHGNTLIDHAFSKIVPARFNGSNEVGPYDYYIAIKFNANKIKENKTIQFVQLALNTRQHKLFLVLPLPAPATPAEAITGLSAHIRNSHLIGLTRPKIKYGEKPNSMIYVTIKSL